MNKQTKILIVDDEKNFSEMLREYFIRQKYSADVASDGEEGLIKAREFKPDLILLDLLMPVLDGISVIRELRSNPTTAEIPIVMLTNLDARDKVEEAMVAGTTYYLIKVDYSPRDLDRKIKQILDMI